MTDWKKLAAARGLGIPDADLERIIPTLDGAQAAFRPLANGLLLHEDPAVLFEAAAAEEGQ